MVWVGSVVACGHFLVHAGQTHPSWFGRVSKLVSARTPHPFVLGLVHPLALGIEPTTDRIATSVGCENDALTDSATAAAPTLHTVY